MQLLIILALLLYGGKSNAVNILSEVKPVLEEIGGEEMKQALKSAEEISSVLSAVQSMSGAVKQPAAQAFAQTSEDSSSPSMQFPLSPISSIADREITYSLSKYIARN